MKVSMKTNSFSYEHDLLQWPIMLIFEVKNEGENICYRKKSFYEGIQLMFSSFYVFNPCHFQSTEMDF